MYAIVRSGGKQHRVEEGRSFTVELLPAEEGAQVELNDVLLIADDGEVTVGTPTIEGARVLTLVEAHGRAKKIIVFKYKSKVRTRKKTGHRQHFTRLTVQEILRPGQEPKAAAKPKRRRRKKTEEAPEEAIEAAVEAATVAAPEAPAPKRRTRRKAPEAKAGSAETTATEAPKPKPRTRRKAPKAEAGTAETATAGEAEKKPKRRTRRKTPEAEAGTAETATAEEKPKRRRAPRRKASDETKETE